MLKVVFSFLEMPLTADRMFCHSTRDLWLRWNCSLCVCASVSSIYTEWKTVLCVADVCLQSFGEWWWA